VDEQLAKRLKDLQPGQSFELEEENGDVVTYINPVTKLCTNHTYVPDGMTGRYTNVICKCGTGRVLDPDKEVLKNGKITVFNGER
jgi:hypothetical protein